MWDVQLHQVLVIIDLQRSAIDGILSGMRAQQAVEFRDSDSGIKPRHKRLPPKVKTPKNATWVRCWFAGMWWTAALHDTTPAGRAIVYLTYRDEHMQVVDVWTEVNKLSLARYRT